MVVKRIVKLINNERINSRHATTKACDGSSYDFCNKAAYDLAECTVNSYDVCNKDHAACFNNGYDYCTTLRDTDLCSNSYDYN